MSLRPYKFIVKAVPQLAKRGEARPDGSYPIRDAQDLANAAKDWARTGHKPDVAAWIASRAKALKLPNPARTSYTHIINKHVEKAGD